VSELFRSILVAVDQYRGGAHPREKAIALAQRLGASLRIVYAINLEDIKVLAPGPPFGAIRKRPFRRTAQEAQLAAQGQEELEAFAAACERESVELTGDVLVGPPEVLWAEEARSCDLTTIVPVERDFGRFARWFGSMFWRIAKRSGRPVLISRQDGLPKERMVLLYCNTVASARALPWVAGLCSALGLSLTIYASKGVSRNYAHADEYKTFLSSHEIAATHEDQGALEVLSNEARRPGSQIVGTPMLALDGGFSSGLWFRRPCRLVERLIRTSPHSILLCP